MFRLYMDTIDYKKLIELQAKEAQGRVSHEKSKSLRSSSQTKSKIKKLNNSVKRHH